MAKNIIIILTIVSVLLLAAIAYFIFQNQKVLKELASQKQQEQKAQTSTASSQVQLPSPTLTPSLIFAK